MNCVQHPQATAAAFCRSCGKALCAECERDVRGVIYCEDCLAQRLQDPVAAAALKSPAGAPPEGHGPSPGLAAALGFIPGVGAMYNGQFAKGIVHVLIFACLVWMSDNLSGFFGVFIPFFIFYMVFEAYKTAQARLHGEPLPDPFGLEQFFTGSSPLARPAAGHPVPPPSGAPPVTPPAPGANAPAEGFVPNAQPGMTPPVVPPAPSEPYLAWPGRSGSNAPVGAIVLIGLGLLFLLDNLGLMRFHWVSNFWPVILIVVGVWLFEKRWRR